MAVEQATSPVVRAYDHADEQAVLGLLELSFGGWPHGLENVEPREFFRWKTARCPFGISRSLVAERDGEIVGFLAQLPWPMRVAGRTISTTRGTDLAVHPAHRRRGVSQELMRAAVNAYPPSAAVSWNNPNALSRGSVMQVGSRKVISVPRFIRVGATPVRTAGRVIAAGRRTPERLDVAAPAAAEVLSDTAFVSSLLDSVPFAADRLTTARTVEYLRWRYAFEDYRAIRIGADPDDGGIAIFLARRSGAVWLAHVCELLAPRASSARELLRRVGRSAPTDFTCCLLPSYGRALRYRVPARAGVLQLTTRALHDGLPVDPTRDASWDLSLGDLELL